MSIENRSLLEYYVTGRKPTFRPTVYDFRIPPPPGFHKTLALQQPFATLFDNLIAVLWSVYCKHSTIQIGVNQLQWALELLRCMRVDYGYPESVEDVVDKCEDRLVELYASVGVQIDANERAGLVVPESSKDGERTATTESWSYNEKDIMERLVDANVPSDPVTGQAKYLRELNVLGKRKPKRRDVRPDANGTTTSHVIGALQRIVHKTTDTGTKSAVREYVARTTFAVSSRRDRRRLSNSSFRFYSHPPQTDKTAESGGRRRVEKKYVT